MAESLTHAAMDRQAEAISDLLNELVWCESTGFLVVEDEDGGDNDPALNEYLQAFDVQVFDGYVTDFIRMVRDLNESLGPRLESHELSIHVSVDCLADADDPNLVCLTLMIHYHGPEDGYTTARRTVLDEFERIVRRTVEEWSQEEDEDEEPVETLV
jgi:hypothetical protein